jgi:hypothetical protein
MLPTSQPICVNEIFTATYKNAVKTFHAASYFKIVEENE